VTVLSERRSRGPYGLEGGESGMPGRNTLESEPEKPLPGKFTRLFRAGEALTIETPGGGGWGVRGE